MRRTVPFFFSAALVAFMGTVAPAAAEVMVGDATPLAGVAVAGLSGSASRAVAGLTEPGALLVWGTLLAVLARVVGRRRDT